MILILALLISWGGGGIVTFEKRLSDRGFLCFEKESHTV